MQNSVETSIENRYKLPKEKKQVINMEHLEILVNEMKTYGNGIGSL